MLVHDYLNINLIWALLCLFLFVICLSLNASGAPGNWIMLGVASFYAYLIIGLFTYASEDSMAMALGAVKSGTVVGFLNLALVIVFMTYMIFFGKVFLWSDYTGASIIMICLILQCTFAHKD